MVKVHFEQDRSHTRSGYYNGTNLLNINTRNKKKQQNAFSILFFFGHGAQHAEHPRTGLEPMPPELEAWNLNHWPIREVCTFQILMKMFLT